MSGGGDQESEPDTHTLVVERPADRATGYGKGAVAQGVRVAQAPKRSKKKRTAKPKKHRTVQRAEALLPQIRSNLPQLAQVKIDLLSKFPVKAIRNFTAFAGWTNSDTEFFIRPGPHGSGRLFTPEELRLIVFHEAFHLDQFRDKSNKIPDYTTMVAFEADTYRATTDWLEDSQFNNQTKKIKAVAAISDQIATIFETQKSTVEAATSDPAAREKLHEAFMRDPANEMLPAHKKIADLYHRP